ncbi:hypothetical protein KOAAANKH_02587 [Brevundimonas sp. NIBR10]|nr:hypothetical protein KOAAANKH_02587 [Brevundimonas sp. NIBR10]
MPSVQQELGKYVSVRGPREDGTYRVLFEVPARIRPSDWPSTRPLPTEGRRGDLTDAFEVARIKADAKRFYAELMDARNGVEKGVDPNARTLETLIRAWQGSQAWKDNKPITNRGYEDYLREVRAWQSADNPDPTLITVPDVEAFIGMYDDRPTTRYHVRKVLRMVMGQAVRLKWRTDNPVDEVRAPMPKTRVTIWEESDVEMYAWAAIAAGNPDLAAIILTEWEIGQRLTDIVLFRRGAEYLAAEGVFSFDQSKTANPVAIPVSDRLRGVLAHIEQSGSLYLFHDATSARTTAEQVFEMLADGQAAGRIPSALEMGRRIGISDVAVGKAISKLQAERAIRRTPNGIQVMANDYAARLRPFADFGRLSKVFADVRSRFVIPAGGRHLMLRALRHSCVVQLARCGCEIPEIAAITGHTPASAAEVLKIYMPRDSTVARNAQEKRGLVARRTA